MVTISRPRPTKQQQQEERAVFAPYWRAACRKRGVVLGSMSSGLMRCEVAQKGLR